jgi:hypothetical protein
MKKLPLPIFFVSTMNQFGHAQQNVVVDTARREAQRQVSQVPNDIQAIIRSQPPAYDATLIIGIGLGIIIAIVVRSLAEFAKRFLKNYDEISKDAKAYREIEKR